jgi:uncharacterized protein (TIGR02246 family)
MSNKNAPGRLRPRRRAAHFSCATAVSLVLASSSVVSQSRASEPKTSATITTAVTGATASTASPTAPQSPPPAQSTAGCGPKDKAALTALLETWASAVQNRNPIRALSMYAEDARLQPLDSKKPLLGRPDIRAHYTRELKSPRALVLSGIAARVACDTAIVTGSYGYATGRLIATANGTAAPTRELLPSDVPYRFTMRLVLDRGEWLVGETRHGRKRRRLRGTPWFPIAKRLTSPSVSKALEARWHSANLSARMMAFC